MPVYFVQAGDDGPIKIGFAKNPVNRLPGLQVNNPARLRPLGQLEGDKTTERELHARFIGTRISGEWFEPSPDLLALAASAAPFPIRRAAFERPVGRQWSVDEVIACAGGLSKLAAATGVDHSSVCGWKRKGRIPVGRARAVSDALKIPLHKIRSDIWHEAAA